MNVCSMIVIRTYYRWWN